MRFYVEKCEAMRNFANKIWNASRFVLMNLTIDEVKLPEKLELEDKWVLSRLIGEFPVIDRPCGLHQKLALLAGNMGQSLINLLRDEGHKGVPMSRTPPPPRRAWWKSSPPPHGRLCPLPSWWTSSRSWSGSPRRRPIGAGTHLDGNLSSGCVRNS